MNISARVPIKRSNYQKHSLLSCWYIQFPVLKVCRDLKMAAIFKILKYQTQLQVDMRYENTVPNYVKKVFSMVMTSSMTSQGGLKVVLCIYV